MNQSAQVHLQTLENHRVSFQRMRELASRAEQGWRGEAGTTFQQALEGWMANYQRVGSVLDEMHQRIVGTGNAQSQAHSATTQTAHSLRQGSVEPVKLQGF
jgi:uncharacterized protein YukE